jgi:hypothetical protein
MSLEPKLVEETKAQIERLIRQDRTDEARALLLFLRDEGVTTDADIRQFQNRVGMPVQTDSTEEAVVSEQSRSTRLIVLDRAIGLSIAAFLFFATGSIILPLVYIAIDWIANMRRPLTVLRIVLTALGALAIYFLIALVIAFAS